MSGFDKDLRTKYRVKTRGTKGIANSESSTKVDYKLTQNLWISGVRLILKNHNMGDTFSFNIVDKDFIFIGILYPANPSLAGIPGVSGLTWQEVTPNGVHLEDFGTDINVVADRQDQGKEEAGYWAQLLSGMYIEIKYVSIDETTATRFSNTSLLGFK